MWQYVSMFCKKKAQLEYNILFATIDNQCKPSGAQCSTEFDFQS